MNHEVYSWELCDLPPKGWHCTRRKGHTGPCAAVPVPAPAFGAITSAPEDTDFKSAGCGCLIGCGVALYFCIAIITIFALFLFQSLRGVAP